MHLADGAHQPLHHVEGVAAQGTQDPSSEGLLGIPIPGALRVGPAAHQPIKTKQPGIADPTLLQQCGQLLKRWNSPVFKIHRANQAAFEGQLLELLRF